MDTNAAVTHIGPMVFQPANSALPAWIDELNGRAPAHLVVGADSEKRIDAAEFGEKVSRVLAAPAYRQSARRVAQSMRQFGGALAAAACIEI